MIGEYESYVKGKTQEKKSRDLKAHYANSRYGYKNSLKLEKEELLRVELLKLEKIYTDLGKKYNISANSTLEQQKQKAKWNYCWARTRPPPSGARAGRPGSSPNA